MDAHTKTNRRYWDQLAQIHPATAFYKLEAFRAGENILDPLAEKCVGDVVGKRLLHLQCHFGLDTLSLARMGVEATGLDFSPVAIETARKLAQETNLEADVLNAPDNLRDFDIVFASWGALCWIADLRAWMRSAARALKTGGRLVLLEGHPAGMMLDLESEHATPDAVLKSPRCVVWEHGMESILSALLDAGLSLTKFREHDRTPWPEPALVKTDEYFWKLPEGHSYVPLSFALEAERTC